MLPVGYQKDIDLKTDAVQSATEASSGDIMELFRLKTKLARARSSCGQIRSSALIRFRCGLQRLRWSAISLLLIPSSSLSSITA